MSVIYSAKVEGMDELVKTLTDTADRRARRLMLKVIVAGAKTLRTSIRSEAPYGEGRKRTVMTKGGKTKEKTIHLRDSVRYKASRKTTGQIAYMVGPFGKGSQLRHLVIYGHNIQNRKGGPVLGRTRPNNFVQRGEEKARSQSFDAIASAAKGMIEELGKP
jgi:hypothetical protein